MYAVIPVTIDFVNLQYTGKSTLLQMWGHFILSKNYLSNCLKETHQTTVAAMLDEIRMRKSREMLVRTDLLVKEIVLSCGYVDVNNYIRKFKKQEGVTPLQYRKARKEYAK